jgi:hypothetical protein
MIFLLIAIFQLKHLVADYFCQTPFMLQKFNITGWWRPLAAHCGVHAGFTFIITAVALASSGFSFPWALPLICAILDFNVHMVMDRLKASPNLLGRFKALTARDFPMANAEERRGNTLFWWSLGFDQMIHHLTDLAVVMIIAEALGL